MIWAGTHASPNESMRWFSRSADSTVIGEGTYKFRAYFQRANKSAELSYFPINNEKTLALSLDNWLRFLQFLHHRFCIFGADFRGLQMKWLTLGGWHCYIPNSCRHPRIFDAAESAKHSRIPEIPDRWDGLQHPRGVCFDSSAHK